MRNFAAFKGVAIPEGNAVRIECEGVTLWSAKPQAAHLVVMGDSIAAGHTINAEWATDYGEGSQYGVNGNAVTQLVPGCYADLMRADLLEEYGEGNVQVTSFARSGDTVADLMGKLNHAAVVAAIQEADRAVICIGANDVLQPALTRLGDYINAGDAALRDMEAVISANMATLNNDSASTSYAALFRRLKAINPDAEYVFTTIYNPYKYLWLDESRNGFFGPLLATIPNMDIDVDKYIEDLFGIDDLGYPTFENWTVGWQSIELNLDLDGFIKDGLLSTSPVQMLFDRVNGLGDWTEARVTELNGILSNKVAAQGAGFAVAGTKAFFDTYPDRPSGAAVCYNDLVNVEYTRGYDTAKMDWGQLWGSKDVGTFWGDLAWKYLSFTNAVPSLNVWDYVSFDMEGFAAELVQLIIERVIVPDVDPHPEANGHKVLKQAFDATKQ